MVAALDGFQYIKCYVLKVTMLIKWLETVIFTRPSCAYKLRLSERQMVSGYVVKLFYLLIHLYDNAKDNTREKI